LSGEFEIFEKRIRRLESQNRGLKLLGLTLVVVALGATAWGQKIQNTVMQAQKFELRDVKGRLRAELAILESGKSDEGAALRFFDADGDVECLLDGDVFTIFKKGGDNQATFGKDGLMFEDGDSDGKIFASLEVDKERQMGKLRLNDYRTKTHVIVTSKDLAELLKLKSQ
jgi:hypothetical protein